MTNNINYMTTSNGSSFLDEKKYFLKKDQNIPNNNNLIVNSQNVTCGDKSYTSIHNTNISHTNSLDLNSNQSQFRNNINFNQNLKTQKMFTNNNIPSFGGCYNQYESNEINNMFASLPRNFNNQYGTYNICHDNNYFYKNNMQIYDYKNNQMPQFKINFNDDKNILENLFILIKDQNGCKLIQKKLDEKNPEFLSKFFEKVILFLFFLVKCFTLYLDILKFYRNSL